MVYSQCLILNSIMRKATITMLEANFPFRYSMQYSHAQLVVRSSVAFSVFVFVYSMILLIAMVAPTTPITTPKAADAMAILTPNVSSRPCCLTTARYMRAG